jgi:hypothetical protein
VYTPILHTLPDVVWKGAAIDEDSAELVYSTLPWNRAVFKERFEQVV